MEKIVFELHVAMDMNQYALINCVANLQQITRLFAEIWLFLQPGTRNQKLFTALIRLAILARIQQHVPV